MRMIFALLRTSSRNVGMDFLILKSSSITPSSTATLKSTRTSTRFPFTFALSIVLNLILAFYHTIQTDASKLSFVIGDPHGCVVQWRYYGHSTHRTKEKHPHFRGWIRRKRLRTHIGGYTARASLFISRFQYSSGG